jgi:hypothetical protein
MEIGFFWKQRFCFFRGPDYRHSFMARAFRLFKIVAKEGFPESGSEDSDIQCI